MRPRHEHDCKECQFLGSSQGVDWYFCHADGSLVRRYSSEEQDYGALPLAMVREMPAGHGYELGQALLEGQVSPDEQWAAQ